MNVEALGRWPRALGGTGAKWKQSDLGLNRKQGKAIAGLRQVWLSTALHIINSSAPSGPRVLGVTSAIGGEGKTTNCLGLAVALAQEIDERVLLIECGLDSPSLASHLALKPTPGLVECLNASSSAKEIVQGAHLPNLDAVVAGGQQADGSLPDGPVQPLLSKLWRRLPGILAAYRESHRFIMLDLPPVLTNPYSVDMVNNTDGIYFTVMSGVTPVEGMARALKELGSDKLAGVILIGADAPLPGWVNHLLYE